MAVDITTIPEEDLRKDLQESYDDILACESALKLGVMFYSGGSVKERLDKNKYFVRVISKELARREKSSVVVTGG
jgi:hypothetical protein